MSIQLAKSSVIVTIIIEIIFGKPIPYSALGFVHGGKEEYKKATEIIFNSILSLGGFPMLPEADKEDN